MQSAHITDRSKAVVETCKNCIKAVFAGESVVDYLRDVGMDPQTFYDTLKKYPELSEAYADAKRFRAEMMANEVVNIADSEEDPQKARNRIQARQWYASKIMPREYGDRMDINVTQTIDIGSALSEARARALRPGCDQSNIIDVETVDAQGFELPGSLDKQSSAPLPAPRPSLTARVDQAAGTSPAPAKRGRKPRGGPKA